jgi:hypothetical protein
MMSSRKGELLCGRRRPRSVQRPMYDLGICSSEVGTPDYDHIHGTFRSIQKLDPLDAFEFSLVGGSFLVASKIVPELLGSSISGVPAVTTRTMDV